MAINLKNKTALQFFTEMNTGTLLEDRIQLMLNDPAVSSVTFRNGQLSYGLVAGGFKHLDEWRYSLEDTIKILTTVTEKVGELTQMSETELETNVDFKDIVMQLINVEDNAVADLEERLIHSDFLIHICKREYLGKDVVTIDDLPF